MITAKDKNIRKLAKLRREMLITMNKIVAKNEFKDKEIKFLKLNFSSKNLSH
ncbi:hypothetical protein [Chryseobacterium indoltheticum]|uniref:hypothetical protein n=1 Tax=Chryseobacterium indoltheticum TaxID=254 RepID=UPI003F490C67